MGSWKQLGIPLSADAESTLMFKTEHVGRKSEDAFLLFKLTHLKQRASVSKLALSHLNEFQLEVKSEDGKFASGQKNPAPLLALDPGTTEATWLSGGPACPSKLEGHVLV